jgi:hypothetical protein
MRCPVCFSREVDVVLLRNDHGLYCVKCGFTGSEAIIQDMYADLKKKYRLVFDRLTLEDQLEM